MQFHYAKYGSITCEKINFTEEKEAHEDIELVVAL